MSKYNNYANTEVGEPYGGNGVNEIAILDPYASQPDPNYDAEVNGQPIPVMKQIKTFASPSPDLGNINAGDPDAVREWCTNGTAVDPETDSIFVNNEDGYTYQWNLGTDTITNTVQVSNGYGVPYTPTAIAPMARSSRTTAARSSPWAATRISPSAHSRRLIRRCSAMRSRLRQTWLRASAGRRRPVP